LLSTGFRVNIDSDRVFHNTKRSSHLSAFNYSSSGNHFGCSSGNNFRSTCENGCFETGARRAT